MLRPYEGLLHICPYRNPSTDDPFLLATYLDMIGNNKTRCRRGEAFAYKTTVNIDFGGECFAPTLANLYSQ